jgi:hypothetical protein
LAGSALPRRISPVDAATPVVPADFDRMAEGEIAALFGIGA